MQTFLSDQKKLHCTLKEARLEQARFQKFQIDNQIYFIIFNGLLKGTNVLTKGQTVY